MRRTEKKVIEGITFEVNQLGAREGRRVLLKLGKVLGPVMGSLFELQDGIKLDVVLYAVGQIVERISDGDLDDLCETMGKHTEFMPAGSTKTINLSMAQQDLLFAGKYHVLFQWLAFAIKVNYEDFISALGMLVPQKGLVDPVEESHESE